MNYQRVYDQIIDRAKKQVDLGIRSKLKKSNPGYRYYESHHIVPRCLGGTGEAYQWKWHENIVLLTPREHFLCHWLLTEIYPKNHSIWTAFWFFCNGGNLRNQKTDYYIPSSRVYEYHRKKRSQIGAPKELLEKLRLANLGRTIKFSDESIKKMSKAKQGIKNPAYGKPSHRAIVILKFDKEMNFLEEFPNSYKAAESVNGRATKIIACCKNKRPNHMGYIWKYKEL